jgi:hypothetical protein
MILLLFLEGMCQWLQVLQLVVPHEAHPLPVPLTARDPPLLPLLMAEKRERARVVSVLPQWMQTAGTLAWLMGRNFSKVAWQFAHSYS